MKYYAMWYMWLISINWWLICAEQSSKGTLTIVTQIVVCVKTYLIWVNSDRELTFDSSNFSIGSQMCLNNSYYHFYLFWVSSDFIVTHAVSMQFTNVILSAYFGKVILRSATFCTTCSIMKYYTDINWCAWKILRNVKIKPLHLNALTCYYLDSLSDFAYPLWYSGRLLELVFSWKWSTYGNTVISVTFDLVHEVNIFLFLPVCLFRRWIMIRI